MAVAKQSLPLLNYVPITQHVQLLCMLAITKKLFNMQSCISLLTVEDYITLYFW